MMIETCSRSLLSVCCIVYASAYAVSPAWQMANNKERIVCVCLCVGEFMEHPESLPYAAIFHTNYMNNRLPLPFRLALIRSNSKFSKSN